MYLTDIQPNYIEDNRAFYVGLKNDTVKGEAHCQRSRYESNRKEKIKHLHSFYLGHFKIL